jgi:hypothetical protein
MATANIKITALNDITSANMTYNDLVAVVDMNGTPETKKANIQLVGNLILNGAGGSYFPAAAQAVLAQSVTNAAQPNITSVGTLSSLAVTANVTAGNLVSSGTVNGVLVGEGGNISNVQVGNVAGIGNIATINLDGNVSNIFRGDGTFGPEGAGGNANYANFAGTAYAVAGANVSGEVGFAAVANSVALANVSSAGNIASINLDGNVSNVLRGDGTWDSDANSTYGDSNVVSLLGAFGSNTISTTGLITGDAGGLSNVIGANVTGEVSFAATANAVAGANVSGEVSFAATANAVAVGNVSGIGNVATVNLDGNVSNVLRGDGTFSADANSSYGDSNVTSLLGAFGSNTITTTGIVTVGSVTLTNNARIKDTAGDAVAFGVNAGLTSQGNFSVAMGYLAGNDTQGTRAVAIGQFAGETSQGADAVAIGSQAGETSQGVAAVAIGAQAGETAQGNNSIIINATSAALNQTTPNTFTVAPVRNDTSNIAEVLFYNTTSKEVTYSNTINVSGNISTAGLISGDGSGLSNIAVANVTGLGNISTTNFDGNAANYLDGTGSWGAITLSGDGGNISNIVGANVSGEVSFAATANAIALGNVSGAGNIASINLDGNVSNVLAGDGTFIAAGGGGGTYGDSNVVTLLNAFGSNTITTTGLITGDGGGISNVIAANISGTINLATFAGTANAVAGSNVSGEVPFAQVANSVTLANVSGAGNIASLNIDGQAANVLYGNGVFAPASSPALTGDGYQLSNITGANVTGEVSFAATANAVAGANVSGEVTNAATANAVAGANVSGEVGFSAVSNSVAGANVSGEVTFAATANAVAYANVSGTPTLGNISTINIDGEAANVLYGNGVFAAAPGGGSYGDSNVVTLLNAFGSNTITTTGLITGDGGGLSNIVGANVTGEVGFAAVANSVAIANVSGAGNIATVNLDGNTANYLDGTGSWGPVTATTAGTVTTAAQPNITSLGTLVDLTVTGNIAGANINANTNGFAIGYKEIPPVVLSANDTLALEDSGKHFRSTTAGNITLSIPTNATVAFPTGTAISIVEQAAGNILVNAISGVTLYQAGNSTAGNRVVSTYGVATLMKVDTDTWFISGTGVS